MGETARADHFQYNGYHRATNAYTAAYSLVNYADVTACGTSTADSVPCIFSSLGRDAFTHDSAAYSESLFSALGRLGVDVFWRDNSTGCKGVCDSEHFEQYASAHDSEFCDATGCFDEILLENLGDLVRDFDRDHFVVLHQRGSHGPAYHTDVPSARKAYFPECDQVILRNCNVAEINNAYDNTILYTDYFLSRVIDHLLELAPKYDIAMLYVSDHGESLGENGLYLHGFPYPLAPAEQLKVPMIFWASRSFYASEELDPTCLQRTAAIPISHDSVFHTLLAILDIESAEYRAELDLFAECRHRAS
jgi:lipid A ethanolaminephosphotransferase